MRRLIGIVLIGGGMVVPPAYAEMAGAISIEAGFRSDDFDWNIGGIGGQNPNIISELSWKDMQSAQGKLSFEFQPIDNLFIRGYGAYGEVDDGKNQDSDYLFDDRQGEFSRSNNKSKLEATDASIGIGYKINTGIFQNLRSYVLPSIGYSIHTQDFTMTEGFQTIPATGGFDGLNSTYDAEWSGMWYALSFGEENVTNEISMEVDIVYHVTDYEASADWNLRTDFMHPISYQHFTDGKGITISFHGKKVITDHFYWAFSVDVRRWTTDRGLTYFYLSDGTVNNLQPVNEVNWESFAVNFGIGASL